MMKPASVLQEQNPRRTPIPRVLTIAGSDSGGGAGIQADLRTFGALGVYGMTAITAITAQNTLGVQASFELPSGIIEAQVRSVVQDIGVDAVKTGMLAGPRTVELVCALLEELRLPNLVVDPVMTAKGGFALLQAEALEILRRRLLLLARVLTPNLDEASALLGRPVRSVGDMCEAAKALGALGPEWVVVKGGHLSQDEEAIDVVYHDGATTELAAPRATTSNTHGTGCTFSAAIAAGLAKGQAPEAAIRQAKDYITRAINESMALGHGHGPVGVGTTGGAL